MTMASLPIWGSMMRVAHQIINHLRQCVEAMIGSLFRKRARNDGSMPAERYYAIGDIHGCLDALEEILNLISDDWKATRATEDASARLVFLGDYVDRGPDSRGVIDRLLHLKKNTPRTRFLKGNHEAALLKFLEAPRNGAAWLDWGGAETLESYGLDNPHTRDEAELASAFRKSLPDAHLAFLEELSPSFETPRYFFAHAGVKPGVPLADQVEDDLLWIRGEFHNSPSSQRPLKTVVHGHHPVKKPQDAGWRINIDTGACWTGKLTAVALGDGKPRFLST